jgi:flagellar biosynthesis component FlhA
VGEPRSILHVEPALTERLIAQVKTVFDQAAGRGREPVLIVASAIRPALAQLFAVAVPRLVVMSINEVGRHVQLERMGVITSASVEAGV